MDKSTEQGYTVDLMHILRALLARAYIIITVAVLAAVMGFSLSAFVIKPEYSSTIRLYVNNIKSATANNTEISSSQIDAAQKLVNTYREILHSRSTYDRILERSGADYSVESLSKMIVSGASNNTEVMYVTVTTEDPYESAAIANCIAEVLPLRISTIIDGASVEIIENAVPETDRVSPSIAKYTLIGFFLGAFAAAGFIVVSTILDNTIHDEDYVIQTYDYPILAKIPNLFEHPHSRGYGYYKAKR